MVTIEPDDGSNSAKKCTKRKTISQGIFTRIMAVPYAKWNWRFLRDQFCWLEITMVNPFDPNHSCQITPVICMYLKGEVRARKISHSWKQRDRMFENAKKWLKKSHLQILTKLNRIIGLIRYSCVPNKRSCTPYLILVQLPPYTILFGPARLLIFENFSSVYEIKF